MSFSPSQPLLPLAIAPRQGVAAREESYRCSGPARRSPSRAGLVLLAGIIPALAWRAAAEERVLDIRRALRPLSQADLDDHPAFSLRTLAPRSFVIRAKVPGPDCSTAPSFTKLLLRPVANWPQPR